MNDQIELQNERQKPACCDDSECVWAKHGEPNHSCPEFVEVAVAAQMEDLDNFNKMKVLYRIMDWVMKIGSDDEPFVDVDSYWDSRGDVE